MTTPSRINHLAAGHDSDEQFDRILAGLPIMPIESAMRAVLLHLLDDSGTSTTEMAQAIMRDPTLATRVLNAVNSPFFSLDESVRDVHRAIQLMGFEAVRALINEAGTLWVFALRVSGQMTINERLDGLWQHSVTTGVAARILAQHIGADEISAFAAGLLHDIGKAVMTLLRTSEYERVVWLAATSGVPLVHAERHLLDFDHAKLGRRLIWSCGQPGDVCHAVGRHHTVRAGNRVSSELTAIVHMADILARTLDIGWWGDRVMPRMDGFAREALHLRPEDALPLLNAIEKETPHALTTLTELLPPIQMLSSSREA